MKGEIEVSGSKNAVLPMMAASLLTKGTTRIANVPYLRDIKTMSDVLRVVGAKVTGKSRTLEIDTTTCDHLEAPYELVKTMRASIYVLGPLLARYGRCRVSLPGGCAWGPRPVNFHIAGLERMGAKISIRHGYIQATARRLKGTDICFDIPSVGATANLMMAATLAQGKTTLQNAAKEPEIEALGNMLKSMGAHMEGAGSDTIVVEGVRSLTPASVRAIPDRIEAGTFLLAGAAAGRELTVKKCNPGHLTSVLQKLEECGVDVHVKRNSVTTTKPKSLRGVSISTAVYPGFPTDMQAQFMVLLCLASGPSVLTEHIYPDRFSHVPELERMGVDVKVHEGNASVSGSRELSGAHVMATDLRASAALVIAGLVARGETHLHRIYHIDRGYESIEKKLQAVGAEIRRVDDELPY